MRRKIYLDYAATTPLHPEVLKAMLPYLTEIYGNPSSVHSVGQEAKEALEQSRQKLANLIGARNEEIVFTSGGTEADNLAIKGVAFANRQKGDHIITSRIEHHAVIETCRWLEKEGFSVTYLPVDAHGTVSPDDVRRALTSRTILISIMHANNEIGTIEPIAEISKIAHEAEVYLHTDAVQTVGHIPVNVNELGVHLLSLSAHKFYGPKGVGALYVRKGTKIASVLHGGGQEKGYRSGTENIAGIVGLGKAAELAKQEMVEEMPRLTALRDYLIDGILNNISDVRLNGHPVERLPNNVHISVAYVEGEAMLLNLDLAGICVSTGSACSSVRLEPSHVLTALGLTPTQAHGSIRFTLRKWTTKADIDTVLHVFPQVVSKLRALSPLAKSAKGTSPQR
jgi:cysteine desulfurase